MYPDHPTRLPTFDYVGFYRYSLRFCTHARAHRFIDRDAFELVLAQFLRSATEERFAILAYCFMPDHVHLLVEGLSAMADGRRFIAKAKQYSGFYYKKTYAAPLWQRYGYERVLRNEEATLTVARYIVANPVRAGLVVEPRDYAFVGSCVFPLEALLDSVEER
jgi:REP-associated tyrosine transposase